MIAQGNALGMESFVLFLPCRGATKCRQIAFVPPLQGLVFCFWSNPGRGTRKAELFQPFRLTTRPATLANELAAIREAHEECGGGAVAKACSVSPFS